ncbi:hypothetical protein [Chlorobium phaeobacteroides]|jgi:hypothetical protein|uniref:Uncharacterized protein n=1 Tax=Chlorobium phaeobacteroides (strain DSM 266 / SMG 266 / 2430) TaxID=290317 RepID=A1BFJ6_CHLPD|nr:hypothetical protein [Chlorobium phaeobacteroides]ABL65173.1 hypothetical protein Cpha266_1133 [Chlorobium phaeobacteroides DSM 266]
MNESVKKWLDELEDSPAMAIQKLILGYAGVVAWSRSSLRESFIEIYQTHPIALDEAVAGWLEQRLMKLPPENTPTLVWASHLQDLFSALAGLPLPQVARYLRDHLRDIRSWLHPLRRDESLDPEAAYLAALAWAETNQNLEGMWQGLALQSDHEPAYYIDIGLLGLRKTRDELGRLPEKVPSVLLTTLIDLADAYGVSQKTWLLTTRAILGGYRYSRETWIREFTDALVARPDAKKALIWLKEILPNLKVNQDTLLHSSQGIQRASLEEKIIVNVKQKWIESLRAESTIDLSTFNKLAKVQSRRGKKKLITSTVIKYLEVKVVESLKEREKRQSQSRSRVKSLEEWEKPRRYERGRAKFWEEQENRDKRLKFHAILNEVSDIEPEAFDNRNRI